MLFLRLFFFWYYFESRSNLPLLFSLSLALSFTHLLSPPPLSLSVHPISAPGTAPPYHATLTAAGHYSPYALSGLTNSYPTQHQSPGLSALQTTSAQRVHNGSSSVYTVTDASTIQHSSSASSINGGLYGSSGHSARSSLSSQTGMMAMMNPFSSWHMASPASALLPSVNASLQSGRQSSNIAPLQSPLTAQVYTGDTSHLRTHTAQSLDDTHYSLAQHSPDQMLPECASTEPSKLDSKASSLLYYCNVHGKDGIRGN